MAYSKKELEEQDRDIEERAKGNRHARRVKAKRSVRDQRATRPGNVQVRPGNPKVKG